MQTVALTSPLLSKAGFVHGFSTRSATVDPPGGITQAADRHLAAFCHAIGRDTAGALRVKQVHGARVLREPRDDMSEEADAIVLPSTFHGVTPIIRTADCVPVLLADPESGTVGAVHAGWRGVAQNILRAAADAFGPRPSTLLAAVGPCLCVDCFEVGEEVVRDVVAACDAHVVDRSGGGRPRIDLRRAVRFQLLAIGLQPVHIDDVPGCTRCEADRFFSYRRDGADAGRQFAAIAPRAT